MISSGISYHFPTFIQPLFNRVLCREPSMQWLNGQIRIVPMPSSWALRFPKVHTSSRNMVWHLLLDFLVLPVLTNRDRRFKRSLRGRLETFVCKFHQRKQQIKRGLVMILCIHNKCELQLAGPRPNPWTVLCYELRGRGEGGQGAVAVPWSLRIPPL